MIVLRDSKFPAGKFNIANGDYANAIVCQERMSTVSIYNTDGEFPLRLEG